MKQTLQMVSMRFLMMTSRRGCSRQMQPQRRLKTSPNWRNLRRTTGGRWGWGSKVVACTWHLFRRTAGSLIVIVGRSLHQPRGCWRGISQWRTTTWCRCTSRCCCNFAETVQKDILSFRKKTVTSYVTLFIMLRNLLSWEWMNFIIERKLYKKTFYCKNKVFFNMFL